MEKKDHGILLYLEWGKGINAMMLLTYCGVRAWNNGRYEIPVSTGRPRRKGLLSLTRPVGFGPTEVNRSGAGDATGCTFKSLRAASQCHRNAAGWSMWLLFFRFFFSFSRIAVSLFSSLSIRQHPASSSTQREPRAELLDIRNFTVARILEGIKDTASLWVLAGANHLAALVC
jgi:hypothetical protein